MNTVVALAIFFFITLPGRVDAADGLVTPPPEQPNLQREFYRPCLNFIRSKRFKEAYMACEQGYVANEWWSWWGLVRLNQAFDFKSAELIAKMPDPYGFLIESQCLLHYKFDDDKAGTAELCASSPGKRGPKIAEKLRQDLQL
ncbi:hypothetical protein [Corallincola spongiicola]|uniref:Uncharacterized protein n=1 Tax=Corallincola spongiicola TaxID=2520508 RepID=A0ABY1WMH9_9GAMM|nr:hypothetical protein [Corallincola spongiicola]TAA43615.1 hypothetical protein EXY25_13755 [Corallincola spongiicola]